jgi:hypothetical protein
VKPVSRMIFDSRVANRVDSAYQLIEGSSFAEVSKVKVALTSQVS